MAVYLVADLRPGYGTRDRKPYWRIVGYFPSIIHAVRFAGPDSIVTEWQDKEEAWQAYQAKELPREGNYRVMP